MKIGAVVLAAGKGTRMQSQIQKQYLTLAGKPLGAHCIGALEEKADEIVLVSSPGEEEFCYQTLVKPFGFRKVTAIVAGGKERYHSVYAGLKALKDCDIVLIQDCARPCLTGEIIDRCIEGANTYGACVAAVPSKDTVKEVSGEGYALRTPDRNGIWIIQTPQAFRFHVIKAAYDAMMREDDGSLKVTDDAMVVERWGDQRVYMVLGAYENIKVTTPEDLEVAEIYLGRIQKKSKKMVDSLIE